MLQFVVFIDRATSITLVPVTSTAVICVIVIILICTEMLDLVVVADVAAASTAARPPGQVEHAARLQLVVMVRMVAEGVVLDVRRLAGQELRQLDVVREDGLARLAIHRRFIVGHHFFDVNHSGGRDR